jgi:hypothetical protein
VQWVAHAWGGLKPQGGYCHGDPEDWKKSQ